MCHFSTIATGELFAVCPVDTFPGISVEPVSDSSRYFVLRLQDTTGTLYIHVYIKPGGVPDKLSVFPADES